jgi:hypothetical protein
MRDELYTLVAKSLRILAAEIDLTGIREKTYEDYRGNPYMTISIKEEPLWEND